MIRLLCLTSHADTLNSIRPEAEMLIGIARAGVITHVMTQPDSPYAEQMRAAGITLSPFSPRRKISPRAIRQIREYIARHDIDIVYAFNNIAISNAVWACTGSRVRLLTYRGQTGNIERYDPSSLLTHRHPRVDGIVCVAKAIEHYLRPRISPRVSIYTVYKGHDLSWYQDPAADRSALGLADSDYVVGCVANNRPRKGVRYLIDACAALADLKHLKLVLIGAGMSDEIVAHLPDQHPLRDRIVCLGVRHDVTQLIQMFDVAVLPSIKREGLPKTIIEAMAYALPCIVTDTGGNAELVAHEQSGLVVPVADSAALAAAIRRLADDPALAKRMGAVGRQRIAGQFSIERSVRDLLAVFEAQLRSH